MDWHFPLVLVCALIGYVLGNFSAGLVVSKLYGRIDIRNYGSGNTGMTNVMRTLGWVPSILTFVGDTLKGLLAAIIGGLIAGEAGMHVGGVCAIIGHNWPLVFRFRGGKGISASFGYIIVADWRIALLLVATQLIVLVFTRYMSLASIVSAFMFSVLTVLFGAGWERIMFACIATALAFYSHRDNIKRLRQGCENRLDSRKITEKSEQMVNEIKNRRKKHE